MAERKCLFTFAIILFLAGTICSLRIGLAGACNGICIRADGSVEPPSSPISTTDNITYALIGNVSGTIVIQRDNIIVDGAGFTLDGRDAHESRGVDMTGGSNISIENVDIRSCWYGVWFDSSWNSGVSNSNIVAGSGVIFLHSSSGNSVSGNNITASEWAGIELGSPGNTISGNNISANLYGIYLYSSSSCNTISGNSITNNRWAGICLESSSNNSISGNNVTGNSEGGIGLGSCSGNNVSGNYISGNNWYGISLSSSSHNSISGNRFLNDSLFVRDSYKNSVENNTVNSKPLVYLEGASNCTVNDAGQVILVRCQSVKVEGVDLSRADVGAVFIETGNSTISGSSITANTFDGIRLESSSNNSISGNNVTGNLEGVKIDSSSNNSIIGNNIESNRDCGILLMSSSKNTISGNKIAANVYGVSIDYSLDNTVSGNIVTKNRDGIYLDALSFRSNVVGNNITANDGCGISLFVSSDNTLSGNFIRNNDRGIQIVGASVYGYYCFNNSIIWNNITANNHIGIHMEFSSANTILGNNIADNGIISGDFSGCGIDLFSSSGDSILGNSLDRNCEYGIRLNSSSGVDIANNRITNSWFGIELDSSSNNNVVENTLVENSIYGIRLESCSQNSICQNNVASNEGGINLRFSTDNSIFGNWIVQNKWEAGIGLWGSFDNRVFHNNFINNSDQVYDFQSLHPGLVSPSMSLLDNGLEGNYWSDYNGTDSNQNGIGDTPYAINENNTDHYPLMGMFSEFNISLPYDKTENVIVISNSTVLDLNVLTWLSSPYDGLQPGQPFIQFTATGENGSVGFCRLMIPRTVLNSSSYIVLVDEEPVNATELPFSNSTHVCLYFTYSHSAHEIIVTVPEYTSLLIPVWFMLVTLLAIVVCRRKSLT